MRRESYIVGVEPDGVRNEGCTRAVIRTALVMNRLRDIVVRRVPSSALIEEALLHVALGTGLRPEDLKAARGTDVTADLATGAVLVAAHGGAHGGTERHSPRTAWVRTRVDHCCGVCTVGGGMR